MNKSNYPMSMEKQLQNTTTIYDRLGKPIDDGIKLLVAALWAHGFTTTNSCEGHSDIRNGGPFVWIESKESLNMTPKMTVIKPIGSDEYMVLHNKIVAFNLRERARLLLLMAEFYADRNPPLLVRIIIEGKAVGSTKLVCQGAEIIDETGDDKTRDLWLREAQNEFALFTDFLINKL